MFRYLPDGSVCVGLFYNIGTNLSHLPLSSKWIHLVEVVLITREMLRLLLGRGRGKCVYFWLGEGEGEGEGEGIKTTELFPI